MAEALVIAGFLGLLVVLQVKDQKKIIVAAQTSWIRMGLSIALTVAILVIFWPSNLADQIKLGAFAAIILINGFLKEGLSQEGVVKLGVLNGEFARYPQIQIEELAGGNSFVSFYKSKNNSFSLVFGKSQAEMVAALQQLATDSELVLGEMADEKRPLAKGECPMIYVARHGQTQYNVDGKICGHADIELTEVGYAQAEELAQLVSDLEQPITKIYVSPLRRAQETARIINEKVSVPIEVEPRLIEMDFGQYDGLPIETPEFQKVRVEFSLPLPDGESIMDVAGRVYPLLAELEQSDEDVLLVCHNALIRVIDNYFHGKTMIDFLKFNVDNTQLLRYERKRY